MTSAAAPLRAPVCVRGSTSSRSDRIQRLQHPHQLSAHLTPTQQRARTHITATPSPGRSRKWGQVTDGISWRRRGLTAVRWSKMVSWIISRVVVWVWAGFWATYPASFTGRFRLCSPGLCALSSALFKCNDLNMLSDQYFGGRYSSFEDKRGFNWHNDVDFSRSASSWSLTSVC